jgi:dihydrodipicolinate synthase/N-acetylneuraminate lyase
MSNDVRRKVDSLKDNISGGVIPAMATPLRDDASGGGELQVDENGVTGLVDLLIDAGVKGLFIGGTTGEGILLPEEERFRLHETTMEAIGGRVPALIHVGANTSSESIRLAEHARAIDAEAIVAVTPYFYPIHDLALLSYYQSVAEAAPGTPFFAYDIPHLAINGVAPELVPELVEAIPSFAGLKSSTADAQHIRRLVDVSSGRTIVLAGNERIALGSMALGVDGLISGLSTAVPEPFVSLAQSFAEGDIDQARIEQKRINRILDLIPAGARIGAIKMILSERGIAAGPAIPPRPMPAEGWSAWSQISSELIS